jgi:hypothetical protein
MGLDQTQDLGRIFDPTPQSQKNIRTSKDGDGGGYDCHIN